MTTKATQGYSRAFWVSNTVEMFERMAYYAIFIVITLYLSKTLGFNDLEASMISGLFSGGLYLLPIFTGAYADKIGFRRALIIAFTLLTVGYLGLAMLPTFLQSAGLVEYGEVTRFNGLPDSSLRWIIVPIMIIIVVGGSIIKSTISASVAKETTSENRARGYSIFYMLVNIGSFSGKSIIDPLRHLIGEQAYITINYFSALGCDIPLSLGAHRRRGQEHARHWRRLCACVHQLAIGGAHHHCHRILDCAAAALCHYAKICYPHGGRSGSPGLDSQCESACGGVLCGIYHPTHG